MPDQPKVLTAAGDHASTSPLRLSLNGFLLRRNFTPRNALTESAATGATLLLCTAKGSEPVSIEGIDAGRPGDVILALLSNPSNIPPWQRFIEAAAQLPGYASTRGPSEGAVVFVAVTDPATGELRWMAWTFGSGSRCLRKHASDPRFGLLVALNAVSGPGAPSTDGPGRLERVKVRTSVPYTVQSDQRAPRSLPLEGFRLDRLIDLVNGAGGKVDDGPMKGSLFGMRSIHLKRTVANLGDLRKLAVEVLGVSHLARYQNRFAWVDNYVLLEDTPTQLRLEEKVRQSLLDDPASVDILIPDEAFDLEDGTAVHYVLLPRERVKSACSLVLTTDMVAKYLAGKEPTAMQHNLRFLDEGRNILATATIFDCLAAELTLDERRFVLYDGDFYEINNDFVARINEAISDIDICTLTLPHFDGHGEPTWNQTVAAERSDAVCLDTKLIRLPGETPFEACDVLMTDGTLIHAKCLGRASKVTYVLTQAVRSAQFLAEIPEARRQLNGFIEAATEDASELRQALQSGVAALGGQPRENQIVIALLGDWHSRTLSSLPLIIKASLVEAVRQLRIMGYRPQVAMVGLITRPELGTAA